MKKQTITALKFLLLMTILTGLIYPLTMTGFAQLVFPGKANGSLIIKDGQVVGSELIGQIFDSSNYFWSRPSAIGYNPLPSGASNYGPASDTLRRLVAARKALFARSNGLSDRQSIPGEMIFASGSGLDPHISPEAALLQVNRITNARHFNDAQQDELLKKIRELTEKRQYLIFGEPRVNVLILNIELDRIGSDVKSGN